MIRFDSARVSLLSLPRPTTLNETRNFRGRKQFAPNPDPDDGRMNGSCREYNSKCPLQNFFN